MSRRATEILVGLFMIIAIAAFAVLAIKVSGLTSSFSGSTYTVTADFDNVGSLKVNAPVKLAGVKIGSVASISYDPQSFRAVVTMQIQDKVNNLPLDSSASILTEGLLGANYVGIGPGFSDQNLKNGSQIQDTHAALILENLIGQLLFNVNKKK
ncbi:MAG: outer membrane lipid asymmetry maintenance protein MlaD [Gammaproteobacteria bacterium]|nr:outer membrane lipid asymmetry maintenance protein MlaD [Gammaproteobacteria bacterium]